MLSFHQAQPPTTLPHGTVAADPGLCTVILRFSCSKLSVAREKKPQCVSGPHYLGRTLRTSIPSISSYRPGSFQRTTMPQNHPQDGSGLQVHGAPATPPSSRFLLNSLLAGLCPPMILQQFRQTQATHLETHIQQYCSPCNRRPGKVLGTGMFTVPSPR